MSEESLTRAVRTSARTRTLGATARCVGCGADSVAALQKRRGVVLCYECAQAKQGKATIEEHHLLGRRNADETIGLPGNIHRTVSDRRYEWPERVRTNPDRDPLIWVVGLCYSVRDLCRCFAEQLDRVGRWLLSLAEALRALFGAAWWDRLGIGLPWGEATA